MQPPRRPCIYASFALLLSLAAPRTFAKNLTITSSPPGARVEINGVFAGTTPYKSDYPGGYFHKPHTVFGSRLNHAMVLRISKDGYLTEKLTITGGPFQWISINGRHHGGYFLLKSSRFKIQLEPVSTGDGRPVETIDGQGPMRPPKVADSPDENSGSRTDAGRVAITSDPPAAEIYVDGEFEGQTPATLRLKSGLHHVEVRFSATQKWQRDLDVLRGSKLTLNASNGASR
ncbi:MAG: PEGA domain-containing protein [Candidatus Acidiferrales bacterium]